MYIFLIAGLPGFWQGWGVFMRWLIIVSLLAATSIFSIGVYANEMTALNDGKAEKPSSSSDINQDEAQLAWNPPVQARFTKEQILVGPESSESKNPIRLCADGDYFYLYDNKSHDVFVFDASSGSLVNTINISDNARFPFRDLTVHKGIIYTVTQMDIIIIDGKNKKSIKNSRALGSIFITEEYIFGIEMNLDKYLTTNVYDREFHLVSSCEMKDIGRYNQVPWAWICLISVLDDNVLIGSMLQNKILKYVFRDNNLLYQGEEKWFPDVNLDAREALNKATGIERARIEKRISSGLDPRAVKGALKSDRFYSIAVAALAFDGAYWGLISTMSDKGVILKIENGKREIIGFDLGEKEYPSDFALRRTEEGVEMLVLIRTRDEEGRKWIVNKYSGLVTVEDEAETEKDSLGVG